MILVLFKISLFTTMVLDTSLFDVDIKTPFNTTAIATASSATPDKNKMPEGQMIAEAGQIDPKASIAAGSINHGTQQGIAQQTNTPDTANWNTNNGTFPVSTAVQGEKNSSHSFFASNNVASLKYELLSSGIDASTTPSPIVNNKAWWENMLSIKNLPIPGFGAVSVAHAASLDNVPAPNIAAPAGTNSFTPNSQRVGQEENPAQANTQAPQINPVAAGTAGPQLNYQTPNAGNATKTVTPPAPNINAYTPVEDPNRMQKELARREQELLMLKKQMEQRYAELKSAEERVNKLLKSADKSSKQKSSNLIAVYSNMKPKQAAIALGKIDERVAVQILSGLKPKQAGEILSYADPDVTAKLTELLNRVGQ